MATFNGLKNILSKFKLPLRRIVIKPNIPNITRDDIGTPLRNSGYMYRKRNIDGIKNLSMVHIPIKILIIFDHYLY